MTTGCSLRASGWLQCGAEYFRTSLRYHAAFPCAFLIAILFSVAVGMVAAEAD